MKIIISGGHLTPALAFIDYLQSRRKKVEIVFVGREFTRSSDQQPAKEKDEVTQRNVQFVPLQAAKFANKNPFSLIKQLGVFISAVSSMVTFLGTEKPAVFVSFGSYLAVPIALACWLQRIPIITHEQTRAVGMSNQLIGRLAQYVAVSYPESSEHFPKHKTVVTGNLLRKQLLKKQTKQPSWMNISSELPLLYITGGSQGSEVINTTVSQALPRILREWQVIHQCGTASKNRSYLHELQQRTKQLTKTQQKRYLVREWVSESELAWIYNQATTAVSRAGANTTQELAYYRLPAVLIPLPFSHHQEQLRNAEALANTGGAIIIPQRQFTPEQLVASLENIRAKHKAYRRKLATLEIQLDADKKLFELVKKITSKK